MTTPTESNHENPTDAAAGSHGGRARPSYDDVNTPVVLLVGVISMILTFLTIWFVEGVFYRWESGLVQELNYDVTNPIQADIINGQKAILAGSEERNISSVENVIDDVVSQYKNDDGPSANDGQDKNDNPNGDAGH